MEIHYYGRWLLAERTSRQQHHEYELCIQRILGGLKETEGGIEYGGLSRGSESASQI